MEYIEAAKEGSAGVATCVFCTIPADASESGRVLVHGALSYVVLNRFPYNPGHLLVVPFRHVGHLEELSDEEGSDLQRLLQRSVTALREESDPHGFNIGMNLGGVAGAGIPDHIHWHVVPRWSGDTNFMSAVGQTRVLPELLADTARRLAPRFAS